MSEPKRHHYLPQSYLSRFADPATATRKKPQVWVWSLRDQTWRLTSVANVAVERDLYTMTDETGKPNRELESVLADLEGKVDAIVREKIVPQKELSEEDRAHLAVFIGTLRTRIPAQHDNFGGFMNSVMGRFADFELELFERDPAAFAARCREITGEDLPADVTLQDLRDAFGRTRPNPEWLVGKTLQVGAETGHIIASMNWTFLLANEGASFVTSDNPAVSYNHDAPMMFRGGIAPPSGMLTIPITSQIVLLASWVAPRATVYLRVGEEQVAALNARLGINAGTGPAVERFVVAPAIEFPGRESLLTFFRSTLETASSE